EVDLQTLVLSLRGQSESFRKKIMDHLSTGKAELVLEELEFSGGPVGKASSDAQRKITTLVRRLEKEGQIEIPRSEATVPLSRYGSSLKSSLKLPEGFNPDEPQTPEVILPNEEGQDIEARIRAFMSRRPGEIERFPVEDQTQDEPPRRESA
ncbi:hypothetical protein BVX98_03525, partial [bacterium F11]